MFVQGDWWGVDTICTAVAAAAGIIEEFGLLACFLSFLFFGEVCFGWTYVSYLGNGVYVGSQEGNFERMGI